MDFYHGTQIGGLKELMPFASKSSNLKEACVYLTTRKQVALHYISNFKKLLFSSPMLYIGEDVITYQEMYSGALELSCKGVSGYIYHCIGDYEMNESHGVESCAVSYKPVPISDAEYIEDVYEKIMEYEKQGKFIYEKYEKLPQYRHDIIRGHVIRTIKGEDLLNNPQHSHYYLFQAKFPIYWKEAEVLYKNGLL
ncbi:MAG: hypothetical protein FWD71_11530 [Oscillospiraceae bacterium]|nr:hypothetical protein [Oscillospiraceae bacterium]